MFIADIVFCDIDGCIANDKHRLQWITTQKGTFIDWNYYLNPALMKQDRPFPGAAEVLMSIIEHRVADILYITGRPKTDDVIVTTIDWLTANGFPRATMGHIRFRPLPEDPMYKPEFVSDSAFKNAMITDLYQVTAQRHKIILAFDDLEPNIEMYKSRNIPIIAIRHLDDWLWIKNWVSVLWLQAH